LNCIVNQNKTGILITCFVFFLFTFAYAQNKRPKIGLTLSGGGAKGMAHIGILQAIDSAGLKIDYITGTSMGSIIGAMYAAGYSGDSIEQFVKTLDWSLLFSTSPQLNAISIEEKSEYDKYAIEIPFVKGKFKIGQGIIEGQELWLKMSEVFEPVYNVTDFSKLSIPFKCIGTDLETGNAVVMDHGNIVNAIRASMAIPSVFTPVKYDNKLLVDGGVVNNFPVMDAKKMGADYVIGVNLSEGLEKAEDLETALDILLQIGFFKDAATFEKHKAACNLYILPDMKGYSTGSFAFSDSIIDIGKETGNKYYPYFEKLVDSLNAKYGEQKFVKDRLPQGGKINISKYSVEGLNNTEEKFFFGLLNLHDSTNYSHREMSEAIRRVYGSRYYKIVRYDFLPLPDGSTEMHFRVEENPLTAVKFALNYNDFTKLSLIFNMTSRDFIFKESRAFASIALSENPRFYAEFFKYFNKKRTSRAVVDYYHESLDFPLYKDFGLSETLRNFNDVFDFQLQKNTSRYSYLGVGQQYVFSQIKTEETPSLIYNGHNNYWYSYLSYLLNNVNKKYFSTQGWIVKADAGYVYNQKPEFSYSLSDSTVNSNTATTDYNDYFKIYINTNHYSELNPVFSWSQNLTLAWLSETNPYIADNFVVGGVREIIRNQVSFTGLSESEIKTGSIASVQIGLQYKLAKKALLTGRTNAALYNFYKTGFNSITAKNNLLTGYGLTFGYDSPIGPLEFTVMYCDQDGKVRNNINIGYSF
jgi:NTE family protein